MRRVVVTGMGMITALGCGIDKNWQKLISSTSGISKIDSFETEDLPSKVGGVVLPALGNILLYVIIPHYSAVGRQKKNLGGIYGGKGG